MKFVTGSELLLRDCSEWEAVACRATSIKPQIDALAALVLRWRKMELAAWRDLLPRSARKERASERSLTVWVRLFRLINAPLWTSAAAGVDGAAGTLEPDEDEGAADGDEDDDAERAHLRGFFEVLEHMMTGAEAGGFGFDGYLELLRGRAPLRAEDVLDDGGELGAAGRGGGGVRTRTSSTMSPRTMASSRRAAPSGRGGARRDRGEAEGLCDARAVERPQLRRPARLGRALPLAAQPLRPDHQDLLRRPAQALLAAAPGEGGAGGDGGDRAAVVRRRRRSERRRRPPRPSRQLSWRCPPRGRAARSTTASPVTSSDMSRVGGATFTRAFGDSCGQ